MSRKEELQKIFGENELLPIVSHTIDEILYMESKLQEYKQELDGIKLTAASKSKYAFYNKLYLDTMAKYNTAVQALLRIAIKEDIAEESPLREYFNKINKQSEALWK